MGTRPSTCGVSLQNRVIKTFNVDTYTANCGPPPPPVSGYIIPYTSTLEGTMVIYMCWHQVMHQCKEVNRTSVCNKEGSWEPASDICRESSGIIT